MLLSSSLVAFAFLYGDSFSKSSSVEFRLTVVSSRLPDPIASSDGARATAHDGSKGADTTATGANDTLTGAAVGGGRGAEDVVGDDNSGI
jgi:hypothetical protein